MLEDDYSALARTLPSGCPDCSCPAFARLAAPLRPEAGFRGSDGVGRALRPQSPNAALGVPRHKWKLNAALRLAGPGGGAGCGSRSTPPRGANRAGLLREVGLSTAPPRRDNCRPT